MPFFIIYFQLCGIYNKIIIVQLITDVIMKKEKMKCLSLKLDLSTIEKIEYIMENMNIRTYTEVIRTCLNTDVTINRYYDYTKHSTDKTNNNEFLITK